MNRTLALLFVLLVGPSLQGSVVNQFTDNDQGWRYTTVNNGGGIHYHSVTHDTAGFISGEVDSSADRMYGFETNDASQFSASVGDMLSVEFMIDGTVSVPTGATARFYVGTYTGGNNYFVSNDTFSWDPNADMEWTLHQIALEASNFIRWPNADANSLSFDQVIASPQDIGLVFTGASNMFSSITNLGFTSANGATISLDNFGVTSGGGGGESVPEPASLALIGLGGILMIGNQCRGRVVGKK